MTEAPLRVRLVGWFLILSAIWGLIDVLVRAGQHGRGVSLWIAFPEDLIGFLVGFALRRADRRAYFAALLLLMVSMVEGALFFLVRQTGALVPRVEALCIVTALIGILLAVLLTRPPSTWAESQPVPTRPHLPANE